MKNKKGLMNYLNQIAYMELHPDSWVLNHCPKGCSKGGVRADYFNSRCDHCKGAIVIDKILSKPPWGL